MPDLRAFALSDMVKLSAALRRAGSDAESMEEAAQSVVGCLHEGLRGPDGRRDCVLVRFYRTLPLELLDDDLRRFAAEAVGGHELKPATRCLTLLATAGDEPAWNDRRRSVGHRVMPLASEQIIATFPMVAQLIRQLGLETSVLLESHPELDMALDEKTFNVFYVPNALGSPHIPAQDDFVVAYGVESVLGFGGMLPTGDLFAVMLFSRVPVPADTAELFASLALSVKVAVLPFAGGPTFRTDKVASVTAAAGGKRVSAIEQLLEVHERTAAEQAARVEQAHRLEHRRSEQLQGLAAASVLIGSTLSMDEILSHVTEQARSIIGAHEAVVSLTGDRHPDQVIQPPTRGSLTAPLVTRTGENLGMLQLRGAVEGGFSAADEAILVQLAHLASASIENARAYAREHDIAAVLQQSLLPQDLPRLAGIEVSARYLPGTAGVDVGGDWYDVLAVSATEVALIIGDVVGHDVRAATTMGKLRYAMQAFSFEDPSPAAVFDRLNRFMAREDDETFATAVYLLLDTVTGNMRAVNAGHPPPLLLQAGVAAYLPTSTSPPIGFGGPGPFEEAELVLPPAATLVLYTDGLIERRGEDLEVGFERLRRLGEQSAAAPVLLDHLLTALPGSNRLDDIALLSACRPHPGEAT